MAGTASSEPASRGYMNAISSSHHHCQSGEEALAAWRSSGQVENGTPSTSPPYWDSDEDDDCGQKPSELYGKHTWNIDKFSQISKRELKSEEFDAGGYKWYILIYPQGCDVCNHLSLFLCVANHDKLLPGWSHFAQFTIVVENKDPKKSKFSDTLHRFWKKEHDWGWKKFMELSKVLDGFIDADTLTIKAKVQVIRERADRLFRCLDCEYRRELVKVYLTNVEQICRRFVEERRCKLGKLIDDKAKWSSFCAFWLGIDQNARRRMSREKSGVILRVVIKHFFVEKEVTSTLVMDSLYSGLKALKGHTKSKKVMENLLETVEFPAPIIRMEKDMFVLVDDVLLLLERAATEPLPPKDDKGPQSRMKDGSSGDDLNRSIIERDERRLTELGRRTIEIFVLAHIFSKIEVAYQEAVALKRQEELIREEEAAWMAETDMKARRGGAEKEKKSKKKQGKPKKGNRKGKDKVKDDKAVAASELQHETQSDDGKDCIIQEAICALEKPDIVEDVSDGSDSVNCIPEEVLQADSEPEVHSQLEASDRGVVVDLANVECVTNEGNIPPLVDDGSSTCSSDSVQSLVTGGPYKGNSPPYRKNQKATRRGRNQNSGQTNVLADLVDEAPTQSSEHKKDVVQPSDASRNQITVPDPVVLARPLKDLMKDHEHHLLKKEELSLEKEPTSEEPEKKKAIELPSPSPTKDVTSAVRINPVVPNTDVVGVDVTAPPISVQRSSDSSPSVATRTSPMISTSTTSNSDTLKLVASKPAEKTVHHLAALSRPLSAPLIPGPMPSSPVVSMVPTAPLLARSMSAVGWLGPDPTGPGPVSHSFSPQTSSYRNPLPGPSGFSQPHPPSSSRFTQHPNMTVVSGPMYIPHSSERIAEPNSATSNHFPQGTQWINPRGDSNSRSHDHFPSDFPACTSGRQTDRALTDDFPHLGIINDLLDDGYGVSMAGTSTSTSYHQSFSNGPHHMNRQFTFPGDVGGIMSNDTGPATSSCRFERTRNNGFHRGYESIGGPTLQQQTNPMHYSNTPYANGQAEGLSPSLWHHMGGGGGGGGSDLSSLLTMNNLEGNNGYPYHIADYSNMASGVNGYTVLRPSGGHR